MTGTPSTLTDLLAGCDARGIRLALTDGGGLEVDAPQDALTPDLLAVLRSHKDAIIVRLESDRLVQSTLKRINAACPSDWNPAAEDWQRIDRAEATIDPARRENDRPELLAALADYESAAVDIFAEATSTPPTVAIDDKLTGTLLGLFDERPEPLLTCFDRYGHRAAWRSIHGPHWICSVCHPPAKPAGVAETAELDADGGQG